MSSAEIVFRDAITDESMDTLITQIRTVALEHRGAVVTLYISSPGGELASAFGAYDRLRHIQKRYGFTLRTVASGYCMSAAVVLLQAGSLRLTLPHTMFMLHPPVQFPWGDGKGEVAPYELSGRNALYGLTMELVVDILARRSGLDAKVWKRRLEDPRDDYFNADDALDLGLVDSVFGDDDEENEDADGGNVQSGPAGTGDGRGAE